LLETIRVLIKNTEQLTHNTKQTVEEMKAHHNQQADILKEEEEEEEEEEAYQEEPSSTYWPPQGQEEESSPIYDHSYSYPYQQYQEEPLSPRRSTFEEISFALEEASAALNRTMSAMHSEAEGDRQEFARIRNSVTQSYEKMDAHFKQIMDILKEEKCQGQLVANPNDYYMEDEYTYYYLEQTTTTPRNEETIEENFCEPSLEDPLGECFVQLCEQVVVENQVDERKEEQTEDLEEPHQEKEESTKTFSTLALIPETPRGQERSLLELPNEQIDDIKIENFPESSSDFILVHDEKLFEKNQSGPPLYTDNWNPPAMRTHHSIWCKRR
jgi:hypothetical protein